MCHHHSPSVGLAYNQQSALKVFAAPLTRLPCCFSLSRWLNLLFLSSTPFSSPCLAALCLQGPLRHSIIPLTTPFLLSPPHSSPLSLCTPYLSAPSTHCPPTQAGAGGWLHSSGGRSRSPVVICNGGGGGQSSLWTENRFEKVFKVQSHLSMY